MNKKLYLSVIFQAIRDCSSTNLKKAYDSFEWIGSKDFDEICNMVELNPLILRESISGLITATDKKKLADDIISSLSSIAWQKESLSG